MRDYITKKLTKAGIKFVPHQNGFHIPGVGNFYPSSGKFSIDGVWFMPDTRGDKTVKKQIKKMINLLQQPAQALYPPNPWSTGLAIPYSVEFHHEDGIVERIKTDVQECE